MNMCCCYIAHQGCTGFPWIDAVMRQLRVEGWIPHVARLAVGCFLTRGCLWINWEEGYKVQKEEEQVTLQRVEIVLILAPFLLAFRGFFCHMIFLKN